MKQVSWQAIVIVLVVIVALVYVMPTVHMAARGLEQPTWWPHRKINLGLDLQGGMHLVLEVDTAKAVENAVTRTAQEIEDVLREERIRSRVEVFENRNIRVRVRGTGDGEGFKTVLDREFGDLVIQDQRQEDDIYTATLTLSPQEAAYTKELATEQALETIRNRIDEFGVSEPDIRLQGEKRILIQLPGIRDTERAKELIGRTALLEFKLVAQAYDAGAVSQGNLPPGTELLYRIEENPQTGRTRRIPMLVEERTLLTGASLTDARVQIDSQRNDISVLMKLDKQGARTFERITAENVHRQLAIVLDETVYSAPVIQEEIGGGAASITGNFTTEEAHDLAIVLRAGALPAPVNILEERTVGPSLGADSIRQGLISMAVGGILVILFMVLYYRGAGAIADLALLVNILLIAGGLAALQATLTLPGIAGIILTIGMAVDANVLIFERIREEMRIGKTPRAAVAAGFDRATLTILDANVTTIIAALVLFQFGTGPVKGFAVTLMLGIVASLFTALILSRTIFDYFLVSRKVKQLSI